VSRIGGLCRTRPRKGSRVNGKVLPVEELHFGHWNTDPGRLDHGGDGRELASVRSSGGRDY